MGPGLHAKVEAQILGPNYPWVDFWDQPLQESANRAFEKVVDAAQTRLKKLVQQNNDQAIHLIGHSFGGQIAKYLACQNPSLVSHLILFNSAADPYYSFIHLAKTLARLPQNHHCSEKLLQLASKAENNYKWQSLLELILLVASIENFMELYWFDSKKYRWYVQHAASFPAIDINTFINVLGDFIQNYRPSIYTEQWQGKADIYYSLTDVLTPNLSDHRPWQKIFPKAQLHELHKIGHYAQFEMNDPTALFCPQGQAQQT